MQKYCQPFEDLSPSGWPLTLVDLSSFKCLVLLLKMKLKKVLSFRNGHAEMLFHLPSIVSDSRLL